jgi:two-component system, NarL family, sensor histidine kinase UhpB
LQRLRPPALAELGLSGALNGLVAQLSEHHPEIEIHLAADLDLRPLDESAALTVYRVVQEGLTNALRHAAATRIEVRVTTAKTGVLHIQVADDGQGRADDSKPGFGLAGMGERVWALGGTLRTRNGTNGGFILEVELPSGIRATTAPPGPAARSPAT